MVVGPELGAGRGAARPCQTAWRGMAPGSLGGRSAPRGVACVLRRRSDGKETAFRPLRSPVVTSASIARRFHVFMMRLPTVRFLTCPRPPGVLDARVFAAVMRPPLLFLAIFFISIFLAFSLRFPSPSLSAEGLVSMQASGE